MPLYCDVSCTFYIIHQEGVFFLTDPSLSYVNLIFFSYWQNIVESEKG